MIAFEPTALAMMSIGGTSALAKAGMRSGAALRIIWSVSRGPMGFPLMAAMTAFCM